VTSTAGAVRVRWIHRDGPRGYVGAAICGVVAAAFSVVYAFTTGHGPSSVLTTYLGWDVFALVQIVLTAIAYTGATPQQLPLLVRGTGSRRRLSNLYLGGEGPGTAVTLAIVALVGAAVLPRVGGTNSAGGLAEGIVVVAGVVLSWIVVVISYTVFYARQQVLHGGLEFPGGATEHAWTDYLYFALSVASTFGTTDVTVVSSRMRRAVLVHAAIAFVFNTVIIAMLVSALSG
jgi:uncharacterized membrane protein